MLKIIRNLIIFFICSILATTYANSFENKIILKVNNEIITSLDILTEFEYLQIINSEFKNIKKEEAFKISKNSLIREKIKEIEIKKILREINFKEKILGNLL